MHAAMTYPHLALPSSHAPGPSPAAGCVYVGGHSDVTIACPLCRAFLLPCVTLHALILLHPGRIQPPYMHDVARIRHTWAPVAFSLPCMYVSVLPIKGS
jgi:hypothetical protein